MLSFGSLKLLATSNTFQLGLGARCGLKTYGLIFLQWVEALSVECKEKINVIKIEKCFYQERVFGYYGFFLYLVFRSSFYFLSFLRLQYTHSGRRHNNWKWWYINKSISRLQAKHKYVFLFWELGNARTG